MDATSPRIPIVILAGSDLRRGYIPEGAKDLHFVVGYKGAELRVGGRTLADLVLERIRASDAFGEVYLAGPSRIYDGLVDCPIIETDGHLGQNVRSAVDFVLDRHGAETRVAFMACDVLPRPEEIADVAARLAGSDGGAPPALAISLISAASDLGASGWKPKYLVRPQPGWDLEPYLPGHLGIAWPSRLRMGLLYRLLSLAYQERNRGYSRRRRTIVLKILATLLRRDLVNIARLLPPTLTYNVLRHGLGTFMRWRRGDLDIPAMAFGLAKIVVRRRHFHAHGPACVRIATSHHLSLAKDFDTREELADVDRQVKEGML